MSKIEKNEVKKGKQQTLDKTKKTEKDSLFTLTYDNLFLQNNMTTYFYRIINLIRIIIKQISFIIEFPKFVAS